MSSGIFKIENGDRMAEISNKYKVCMVDNCNVSSAKRTANFGNVWDTHCDFLISQERLCLSSLV